MSGEEAYVLLRAKVGSEKGWLVKSFDWPGLLKVGSDKRLLFLRSSAKSMRVISLALASTVVPAIGLLAAWQFLNPYLATALPGSTYYAAALSLSVTFLVVLWPLGIIGLLFLLDYLTLGIQANHTLEFATLEVKSARIGRFRHSLDVQIGKVLVSPEFVAKMSGPVPKELQLTVACTRRTFMTAFAPRSEAK